MTETAVDRRAADRAYRMAWWSLALYPPAFVGAFVVGEGLAALLAEEGEDMVFWQVLVAAVPALLLVLVPGALSVLEGRRAVRLGRPDGKVPAVVGAVIGLGFVALNLAQYVLGLVLDR